MEIEIKTEIRQLISSQQARHYNVLPIDSTENGLEFYIPDDKNPAEHKDELEFLFDRPVFLKVVSKAVFLKGINKYYPQGQRTEQSFGAQFAVSDEDCVQNLIEEANSLNSSDIHFEKFEEKGRIRIRIDGKLAEKYIVPAQEYATLVNKVKILAHLDIAEKRLPQDGRIYFDKGNVSFDIRVSILPTLHGEKVVLRLLSKNASSLDIRDLGMSVSQQNQYLEAIKKPQGIILISGPTGSGKTTTLYATLKQLNKTVSNILTVEDPIEYTLEGINQVQVKENIGLTFSKALRTFLRQDPDIIMLGEIRDAETAQMAIRAALTGHLVLSTVHTNSAIGTIYRLIDMGVPAYLLASTINISIAQRLVRLLCPHCKAEQPFYEKLLPPDFSIPSELLFHMTPVGCERCYYTGYTGRIAIYEMIGLGDQLRLKIKNGEAIHGEAIRGLKRLSDQAFTLLKEGETSLEEIYPLLSDTVIE